MSATGRHVRVSRHATRRAAQAATGKAKQGQAAERQRPTNGQRQVDIDR